MQKESYESIVCRRTAEFSSVGSQILSIAYSPKGGADPEQVEAMAQLLEPADGSPLEEAPSFFPYLGSKNATYIGEHCVAYRVSDKGERLVPFWLLWDLRPLQPESWENIFGFIGPRMFQMLMETGRGHDDSGDNVIDMLRMSRIPGGEGAPPTDAFYLFAGDYFHPSSEIRPGDSRYPVDKAEFFNGQYYQASGVRRCYIPTWFHVDLVRNMFPQRRCDRDTGGDDASGANPCAPPWPRIETELIAAELDRNELIDMTAPALIELLAKVRGIGDETNAATTKSVAGTAEEPKKRKRPGRKLKADLKVDRRVYEAWETRLYLTYAELEAAMELPAGEAKRACDRHRKRQSKGK